jgi:hypothetical protein
MKPPHHIAGVCLAMALAACSGAQNGATPMTPPSNSGGNSGGGMTHYSVPGSSTPNAKNANKATSALLLVLNEGGGTGGSIGEFPESANGNVAPSSVISQVGQPFAIAFTSTNKGRMGIAEGHLDNSGLNGVQTYALSTGDFLTGICGFSKPSTTFAVAFDSSGNIYVSADSGGINRIEVFPPGQNNCKKPQRTISDGGALAIDSNNLLYVANSKTATIDIFPSGSGTMEAQIGGSNTGLVAPGSVAVDASRNVYVSDGMTSTISEFAAGATGNVAPIRTIAGSKTGLNGGGALAVSKASGEIFVLNGSTNAVLGFAATASGNVAPIQTIAGSATQFSTPVGLAVTN